jgi:Fe2+ or Zn2+ uptake regulation protein
MDQKPDAALRGLGLRATEGRIAVVNALDSMAHASAEQVFDTVFRELPKTSIQSVYNILTDLTAVGLIRRIEPAGSAALYERRVDDNHHHVVCTRCGAVGDVDCVVGHAPCLTPSSSGGFSVQTAEITFWGLCADCQAVAA